MLQTVERVLHGPRIPSRHHHVKPESQQLPARFEADAAIRPGHQRHSPWHH
jgi:hypothetical protein